MGELIIQVTDMQNLSLPIDGLSGLWSIQVSATSNTDASFTVTSDPILYFYGIPSSPDVPELVYPLNNAFALEPVVAFNWTLGAWDAVAEALDFVANYSVVLQVDTEADFSSDNAYTLAWFTPDAPDSQQAYSWVAPAAGSYFWQVTVTKYMDAESSVPAYTRTSNVYSFSVCINVPPITPYVAPIANQTFDVTYSNVSVVISWTPLQYTQFGSTCGYTSLAGFPFLPQIEFLILTNTSTIADVVTLPWTTSSIDLSALVSPNATYYWKIALVNGYSEEDSNVNSFYVVSFVQPTQPPTIPPPQNGTCGNGTCTPPPVATGLPGGAIAGIVVAIIIVAVLFIIAFIWWRRTKRDKDQDQLDKIDHMFDAAPTQEDAKSAYVVPGHAKALYNNPRHSLAAVKDKKIWDNFEQLVVARDFKLPFLLLQCVEGYRTKKKKTRTNQQKKAPSTPTSCTCSKSTGLQTTSSASSSRARSARPRRTMCSRRRRCSAQTALLRRPSRRTAASRASSTS